MGRCSFGYVPFGKCRLKGIVGGGKRIYATYKGKDYKAVVYNNGRIKFNGQFYDSPSAAGKPR